MLKNNQTVRTSSELRSHVVSKNSSLSIFHSKLLVPRAVRKILLHSATLLISTMLRITSFPLSETHIAEISILTIRAYDSFGLQADLADLLSTFRTSFWVFLNPIFAETFLEFYHFFCSKHPDFSAQFELPLSIANVVVLIRVWTSDLVFVAADERFYHLCHGVCANVMSTWHFGHSHLFTDWINAMFIYDNISNLADF